jgi:FMN phosphatase YigB (HAD superfamily)
MKAVGLNGYFEPIIISATYGFRKPDSRLFEKALDTMKLISAEVICVGNDMYRDIYGASQLGVKTVFVDSNQGVKSHENVTPDYFAHRGHPQKWKISMSETAGLDLDFPHHHAISPFHRFSGLKRRGGSHRIPPLVFSCQP